MFNIGPPKQTTRDRMLSRWSRFADGRVGLASDSVRHALANRGVWLGPAHRLSAEHHVVRQLQAFDVDCVIDVGANQGQFALGIRRAGYLGTILSFEPVPEAFDTLARLASGDANWTVHRTALSNQPGTLEINVSEWTQFSSALTVRDATVDHVPGSAPLRVEKVPVTTIDEHLRGSPHQRIFLKSDTQGLDLTVLEGARETLPRVVGVQIELSVRPIYEGMPDYIEACTYLRDLNYVPTGVFAVTAEPVMEFDGVLIRRDLLDDLGL